MNLVGLGNAGCQVVKCLENYPQYKTFCVDTENQGYRKFVSVELQKNHEEYEKNYKRLNLRGLKGHTTVVLNGSGNISGIALRLLEQIKKHKTDVLYIKSDEQTLTAEAKMKEKIVFSVLQQYARSNMINRMWIVDNKNVESILENVSIKNYWQNINNLISNTFHMYNVFINTEPLLTTKAQPTETCRIGTFGVVNFENSNERLFYDLEYARFVNYFYNINEQTMENEGNILSKIREEVSKKSSEETHVAFSIYPTTYDQNYVYSSHVASFIQEQNIN